MDKSQAIIQFLQTYSTISGNRFFFNFGKVEDGAHQMITQSDDITLHRPYVDGSVLRRYAFHLDSFKSVTDIPASDGGENLSDFKDIQDILDWINLQGEMHNFPSFGTDCIVERMQTTSTKPELVGVDNMLSPPMVIYRISVQVDYIDNSKRIWN